MTPFWLIEAGVYGDEIVPLVHEIRRQGMRVELVPHQMLKKGAETIYLSGHLLTNDECVVGYGTYPFTQQILNHFRWKPGAWYSVANLRCSTYYAHFGRFLLNDHYVMMPGIEALRQREWLFKLFGESGSVFVRPSDGDKLFVGRCVDAASFGTTLAPTRYDPSTLIVIAAPKKLGREWRVVVAGDRVVAGSQYANAGKRAITPDCPAEVRSYVEKILAEVHWRPDDVFMIDVGESDGQFAIVELSGFSGSWLYRCDLAAVVSAASERAVYHWQRQQQSAAP
jgi:ATP-grasp domain, R2K clade family 3